MKYSFDEKMNIIIRRLLASDYLHIEELSESVGLSRRSIYYVIDEINKILADNDLDEISNVYGKGMTLDKSQRFFLMNYMDKNKNGDITLDSNQRMGILYHQIFLADYKVKVKDLEDILQYSKFTIMNDLGQLRKVIARFDLTLMNTTSNGYYFVGSEFNKRKAFFYFFTYLYHLIEDNQNILKELLLFDEIAEQFYKDFKSLELEYEVKYFEPSIMALAILLQYVLKRKQYISKMMLDKEDKNIVNGSIEEMFIKKYYSKLPMEEQEYFSIYFVCSRIDANVGKDHNSEDIAQKLIDVVYSITGIEINDSDLVQKLSRHLDLAVLRYKYEIAIDNPLIDDIKKNYAEYFNILKQASIILEDEIHGLVNENEVGFLTLYFAAYLCDSDISSTKIKILVVCLNGTSTSYLLKKEIENLDSHIEVLNYVSVYNLEQYQDECDLIVSTVPIEKSAVNYIKVNAILTIEDKTKILNAINNMFIYNNGLTYTKVLDAIKPYVSKSKFHEVSKEVKRLYENNESNLVSKKNDVMRKDFVSISKKADTWENLIRLTCKPLEKEGYIYKSFAEKLIENIEEYGPYMIYQNAYLLGHAPLEHSKKLGLSFTLLKEPIKIDGNTVEKIIILSYVDYTSHLGILNNLYDLFKNEKENQRLMNCDSQDELYALLTNQIFR